MKQEEVIPIEYVHTGTSTLPLEEESNTFNTSNTSNEWKVFDLLQVLHVCARYEQLTGNSLPPVIDYFGRQLLGQTYVTGFQESLQQSILSANHYLDVSSSIPMSISLSIIFESPIFALMSVFYLFIRWISL